MSADLMAALVANDQSDAPSHDFLANAIRLSVRKAQLALMADPDPSSPWWFLADPHAPFDPLTVPAASAHPRPGAAA